MHYLVPRFIIDRFAQDQRQGSFPAVGLFVDISGFSTITDDLMEHGQHGAEVLAAIMSDVFAPLVEIVYAHGAFIVSFAGDAFTALFPLDDPKPDPFGRALAAAWRIQESMGRSADQQTPYGLYRLSAKVGLADGDAIWGIVSSEDGRRAAYYFRGSAVDGCAQAEHYAGPGEILATLDFCRMVGERSTTEHVVESEGGYLRISTVQGDIPEDEPVALTEVDHDLTARFYPADIVNQKLSGEFRQTVHLFISLPTVRTEAQLEIFMRSLFSLQDQYGGLLSRLDFGDKGAYLLLFWGAPLAHENDIDRALSLILALQIQTSMPISAGITYYTSHAGYVGSPLREDYTCFGRGVNLAARFMGAAPRGEIWLDERVAPRAEHKYEIEFEGEMSFKGFAARQSVYALIERKESIDAFYQGKMVGRKRELDRLASMIDPLSQGEFGGMFMVWGEAGMGKSRLVHAFRTSEKLEGLGHTWAQCQTDQTMSRSLHPFRYWLTDYFGQSEGQTEARNKRSFNRRLDELIAITEDREVAAELDRTRSFLGALLELFWPDSLYEQLDPQNRLENTYSALATLLKAEGRKKPVILHIDDGQWIDPYSSELLERLIATLTAGSESYPVAVIIAARPEGEPALVASGVAYEDINLEDLSREDLSALANELLGDPPDQDIMTVLVDRAEGNPFFAEQIIHHLEEGAWLEKVDGKWRVKASFRERPLPTDVRALLVARLDRLSQEVKEVIQTAAVLGREFELQLLVEMLEGDETVPNKANQIKQAGIWALIDRLRYMFKHLLLQDAAYQMQVHARRRALHNLAAETIASLHKNDLRPYYADLAYHFENAGDALAAADHYILAGDRAHEMGTVKEAHSYFTSALALTPQNDHDRRWAALYRRQKASYTLGDLDAGQRDTQALFDISRATEDGARLAIAHYEDASNAFDAGDDQRALAACDAALAQAEAAGELRISALSLGLKVACLVRLGRSEAAMEFVDKALSAAEAADDDNVLSQNMNNVAHYFMAIGDYSRAADVLVRQVAIQRHLGKLVGQTYGLLNLAYNQLQLGLYQDARDTIEQSLEGARALGAKRLQAYNLLNRSVILTRLGDHEEARAALADAQPLLREVSDVFGLAISDTYLGLTREGSGQYNDALDAYLSAYRSLTELGALAYAADALAGVTRSSLALGQYDRVETYNGDLWTYLADHGPEGLEFPMMAYFSCARAFEATGKAAMAEAAANAGYEELIERANKISTGAWRRSFLENVPEHKALVAKGQTITG